MVCVWHWPVANRSLHQGTYPGVGIEHPRRAFFAAARLFVQEGVLCKARVSVPVWASGRRSFGQDVGQRVEQILGVECGFESEH